MLPIKKIIPCLSAVVMVSTISGCDSGDGLTTTEVTSAAKQRVAETLGLTPEAALFTNVFVGDANDGPLEGELVICGTVEGKRADGSRITPRRFIAGTDPERWVRFDAADEMSQVRINNAADWPTVCRGEDDV